MADVRQQVTLSLITEFENYSLFTPGDHTIPALHTLIDQVVAWSTALAPLRLAPGGSGRSRRSRRFSPTADRKSSSLLSVHPSMCIPAFCSTALVDHRSGFEGRNGTDKALPA
jgi:hypothetical protein